MDAQYIFDTYGLWAIVIGVATMFITSIVKIPIKLLTRKIGSSTVRNLVERLILLIPIGIGIALCYLKKYLWGGVHENEIVRMGAYCGALAIVFYNLFGKNIEAAVVKLVKKDASADSDRDSENFSDSDATAAIGFAVDLIAGQSAGTAIKNYINGVNSVEDDTSDNADNTEQSSSATPLSDTSDDINKAAELVSELTGTDKDLVVTIIEKLKST